MSLGLIPIFSREFVGTFGELGEALALELDTLEQLAADEGVTPLSAFADQRDVPEDFDGSPEQLDALVGPCTDWFDPAAGADAVDAVRGIIDSPAAKNTIGHEAREAVVDELTALSTCLRKAALVGARFRLVLA
jgi:hypothetical protein